MKRLLLFCLVLFSIYNVTFSQSVIIGTGTTTSNGSAADPVDRYYNYRHMQIVYLASELSAGGMTAGSQITALGFSISESAVSLANYTIQIGHTSQTLANPYISSGLAIVKSAFTYAPVVQTAGNFDMITFSSNFTWDGTSNIVIDICTGSNPFTSPYGGLRYTAATNGAMRGISTDGSSNCGTATSTNYAYRPNIQLNYTAGSACSGTPAPGNTISSANPVCSGVNFTLSLQNATTGTGVTYQWQSSATGGDPWANLGTASTQVTSQTVSTYYRCQVTCGANTGTSTPVQVTMNVASVPYTEGFINTTTPTCWDITGWTIGAVRGVTGNPGNNIYKNFYSSATTANFKTIDIGSVSAGMALTFDYKVANYDSPYAPPAAGSGNFVVAVSTDGGANYTDLETVANNGIAGWQAKNYPLAAYIGQNIKVRITGNWTSGDYDLAFDNIKVEVPPSCFAPSALTASSITTSTASIGWTAMNGESAWEYSYGVSPHPAPGGAGTATTNNPTALSGLTGGTTYQFYVRANCGSEFSAWAGPSTFATLPANDECADAITVTVNTDNTCTLVTPGTTLGATQSMLGCAGTADDDVWFKFVATYPAHQFELLNRVAVFGTSTDMVHQVFSGTCGNLTSLSCSDPETSTVSGLTIGQTYYVRVYNYWETSRNTFNLCIKLPPCSTPTGLTATNQTPSGATLNWTENGGANTWDLYIVAAGSPAPDGSTTPTVDNTSTKPYVWTGGTASTPYDWYVRADCGASGGSGQSTWSAKGTFTTASDDAVNWCNLQHPGTATITIGNTVDVYAQTWEPGVTPGAGQGAGISAWIGYSTANTNPSTWTNWFAASYNAAGGGADNDEYQYALGAGLAPGTYYYASRFKLNAGPYTYGGFNGGFWNGTTNISGVLTVNPKVGDMLCNAISLTVDAAPATYSNTNCTGETGEPNGTCWFGTTAMESIWFSFVAPSTGSVKVSTDFDTPLEDTHIAMYSVGNCSVMANLTEIGCDEDGGDAGEYGYNSVMYVSNLISGNTYYVQVDGYGLADGEFQIQITKVPANNTCATATPIPDSQQGDPINGSTTGGTDSGASTVGCPDSTPGSSDVWYLLEDVDDQGGSRVITITIDPDGSENYAIYLYDATCGALGDPVACANSGGNGTNEILNYTVPVTFNGSNGSGERVIRDFLVRIKQIGSNVGSFVMSLTGTALPLQLLDIKATAMPKYNLIEWATASEKNTAYMIVERNNGSSLTWEVIGKTEAAGFSADIRKYSFDDTRPNQKAYYRVRSIDRDGLEQVSKKVFVDRSGVNTKPGLVNAYPMPVSKSLFVGLNVVTDQTATFHLVTITGQSVMQIQKDLKAGVQTVELDLSELPSGVYLARISSPELSETVRIIKE